MTLTLEQKLRTGHVKRWQIVRVAREQTIAEHMYRVYHIAVHLAKAIGMPPSGVKLCGDWAMMHDLPEVVTGDIATPTKRAMRKAVPDQDPVRHIELSLDSEYRELYEMLKEYNPLVLEVVKLADIMEAINFLMTDGMGKHADEVELGLRQEFMKKLAECQIGYELFNWKEANRAYVEVCSYQHVSKPAPAYPVTT